MIIIIKDWVNNKLVKKEKKIVPSLTYIIRTKSGTTTIARYGIATQLNTIAPIHNNIPVKHCNNVTGSTSSICPRSELNLLMIRPTGFEMNHDMGD